MNILIKYLLTFKKSVYKCLLVTNIWLNTIVLIFTVDCTEVYDNGNDWSGSYHVHVPEEGVKPQVVYCDMYQKPGIIVLRRVDRSVLFDRTWAQYKQEFGNLETNYWIGLEMLHQITKNGKEKPVGCFHVLTITYQNT